MAQEIVGVKIQVDGSQATQSVGNIKRDLKEANKELIAAQQNFGEYSNEAIKAAQKVAGLRDQIQEASETAALFDPGKKFQVFAGALSSVAGGFTAVQGALGLVGSKSEEVEKTLLKVQSALALSQGLNTVADSAKDFQRLAAVIKTQVVTAFSTLRGAIIATGIGALGIGLALVALNFEKVKKAVLDAIPGLSRVADFIGKLVNKVTDFIGITSEAGRATAKLLRENDAALKASERNLALNGDKYDEYTKRKIEANNRFREQQNEFLKDESLTEEQRNSFILQARERANREILKADKDRNDAINKQNKEAYDKRKELAEKEEAERKKREEDAVTAQSKAFQLQLQAAGNRTKADEERKKEEEKQRQEDEEYLQKQFELENKNAQQIIDNKNKQIKLEKEAADQVVFNEKAKQDAIMMTGQALGALGQLVGQQTAAGKVLASAEALINTYLGITQIWANKTTLPEPFGTIQKVAATVAAAASGLSAVKNINRVQVPGGGSGVSVPGGVPTSAAPIRINAPQAQLTQLNQQSINQLGQASSRAYVIESDVTSSQDRVARINRAARIG